jgi:hypothetical protein
VVGAPRPGPGEVYERTRDPKNVKGSTGDVIMMHGME